MSRFTESVVEQAALAWLEAIGWVVRNGAEIAPDSEPVDQPTPFLVFSRRPN